MPKPLMIIAAVVAMLASGFSLDGVAAPETRLKRTEILQSEGLVIEMPRTHVEEKSNLLRSPRKS